MVLLYFPFYKIQEARDKSAKAQQAAARQGAQEEAQRKTAEQDAAYKKDIASDQSGLPSNNHFHLRQVVITPLVLFPGAFPRFISQSRRQIPERKPPFWQSRPVD